MQGEIEPTQGEIETDIKKQLYGGGGGGFPPPSNTIHNAY